MLYVRICADLCKCVFVCKFVCGCMCALNPKNRWESAERGCERSIHIYMYMSVCVCVYIYIHMHYVMHTRDGCRREGVNN